MSKLLNSLAVENNSVFTKSNYTFFTIENTLKVNYIGDEYYSYEVYSITGKLLSEGKMLSKGVVNLGVFKTGIYIVKVVDNAGVNKIKVLIK
ncbi:T9SS type A sorting domain-containing protein [Flavobacterium cellulosilyticum]|uniref:T9SS type A sorting domain-containing protein n=1 Tax=Flavobacterium cellulosilyticum TaxID=2541731 RepID=A0A4V2YYN4_9FLAO|nr:T9SS type A sorting domain-containing protein [Flavobacterium cellulosilyticum]TDD93837.1 T9SS type A sorting domain-containing protein [Flavobacterium cellulosilyticum]